MIPLARPDIGPAALEGIREVLASGWVTQGPRVAAFERAFADRTGARNAVAVSSATAGLHLLLWVLGIGAGDEVVVPSYTFVATANAVLHAGASPVFAEISAADLALDPADVVARLSPRTKAVILVHQYGIPAPLADFRALCRARGIRLIEDAACALGSALGGREIGDGETPAVFSFHPRKIITTGEGGMIVTNEDDIAEKLRRGRFHGLASSEGRGDLDGDVFVSPGYNYKMSDIQAAVGIEQITRLDDFLTARRRLGKRYDEALQGDVRFALPRPAAEAVWNVQSYPVYLESISHREEVLARLARAEIGARRAIAPVHREPYARARSGDLCLAVTEDLADRGILLPLYPCLSDEDQGRVIREVLA